MTSDTGRDVEFFILCLYAGLERGDTDIIVDNGQKVFDFDMAGIGQALFFQCLINFIWKVLVFF